MTCDTTNKSAWDDPYRTGDSHAGRGAKGAVRGQRATDTYVGVRRGDGAAQAGVRRRRHLVVHVVAVAHVIAGAGAGLDVSPQLQLQLPGRLHVRGEAGGRAPYRGHGPPRAHTASPYTAASAGGAGSRPVRGAPRRARSRAGRRACVAAGCRLGMPRARPRARAARPRRRPELHVTRAPRLPRLLHPPPHTLPPPDTSFRCTIVHHQLTPQRSIGTLVENLAPYYGESSYAFEQSRPSLITTIQFIYWNENNKRNVCFLFDKNITSDKSHC